MNDGADLLNKTCGTDNPGTVTSDSSGNYMGFQAELSAGVTINTTTRVSRKKNILTEQCWLDCELYNNYVYNPACLLDCFPAGHCLTSLLLDYTGAGGVCEGSFTSQYYPETLIRQDLYIPGGD